MINNNNNNQQQQQQQQQQHRLLSMMHRHFIGHRCHQLRPVLAESKR
jgi:hypothetical protein